jgi:hypothetical protein
MDMGFKGYGIFIFGSMFSVGERNEEGMYL